MKKAGLKKTENEVTSFLFQVLSGSRVVQPLHCKFEKLIITFKVREFN